MEDRVKKLSLTYQWTFDRMVYALPVPGTSSFAILCRKLHPYGINPAGIVSDTGGAWRLDQINLVVSLLGEKMQLRLFHTGFDLRTEGIYPQETANSFANILESVLSAMHEIDEEVAKGYARISLNAHVLPLLESKNYFHQYFSIANIPSELVPDAMAYKINFNSPQNDAERRIVIANSAIFEGSLYVDISAEYRRTCDPTQLMKHFYRDIQQIITIFQLNLNIPMEDNL